MADESQIRQAIIATLGSASADVDVLPSGAVSITVRYGNRAVVMDGQPDGTQWGVSDIDDNSNPFVGHDHVVASLDDALALARRIIDSAAG